MFLSQQNYPLLEEILLTALHRERESNSGKEFLESGIFSSGISKSSGN
jgi:hypothetical protein